MRNFDERLETLKEYSERDGINKAALAKFLYDDCKRRRIARTIGTWALVAIGCLLTLFLVWLFTLKG